MSGAKPGLLDSRAQQHPGAYGAADLVQALTTAAGAAERDRRLHLQEMAAEVGRLLAMLQ